MQIANDSAAVKKMASKVGEVISKLKKNNSEIESELSALNTRWNDANYQNLKKVIEDKKHDLIAMLKEMEEFKQWLDKLHGVLYSYENAERIK